MSAGAGEGEERSSIKPNLPGTEQIDKPDLKFSFSTEAYDSYVKEGFEPPGPFYRPDKFELRFLNKVDITKGKIKVEITKLVRVREKDYSSETGKQEYRDFVTWESNWYAKDWLENDIVSTSHIEGKYKQQTKKLVRKIIPETGKTDAYYVKGVPREVYTIPFSKAAVDKILQSQHPFGPDSINITDTAKVIYVGKISNVLGVSTFRCADYSYEQFVVPEWKTFVDLATQYGGPTGRLPIWMADPDDFNPAKNVR